MSPNKLSKPQRVRYLYLPFIAAMSVGMLLFVAFAVGGVFAPGRSPFNTDAVFAFISLNIVAILVLFLLSYNLVLFDKLTQLEQRTNDQSSTKPPP